jgi:hypothetical protein
MADPIDLTGDIALAVDGAAARGHALVVGHVDDAGYPVVSFRGSVQVHDAQHLALWARNPEDGLAKAIAERPQVTLVYYEPDGPGAKYLSFRGRARVDPSADDAVYAAMIQGERDQDADRNGVAILIDVESVQGFGAGGGFQQGG